MKKSLILLALPVMLLLGSSFNILNDHSGKSSKKTVKRCGPTIVVYSTGISTNWLQLIYVPNGTTYTVTNPVFPYTFPGNLSNGDYIINVGISAYPSTGVAYAGMNGPAGEFCKPIINKTASISFTGNVCTPAIEVRITPFVCR
ncbi:hypothetical protein [Chitinophaga arvensicola]|uniref:Uncharacterized protein n=1 Tax=Chitinophaga arvensicola TaxID=29529 RepID=A0A1I0RL48_9BACT|nr:hypothetical protein [Chitinophaga arvensicola]SEW41586.1 hypothetical protein SAMN04488122_2993 [Chitinophaga arvensicola]